MVKREVVVRKYKNGFFVVVLTDGKRVAWRKQNKSRDPTKRFLKQDAVNLYKATRTLKKGLRAEVLDKVIEFRSSGARTPQHFKGKVMVVASTLIRGRYFSASSRYVTVGSVDLKILNQESSSRLFERISKEYVDQEKYDESIGRKFLSNRLHKDKREEFINKQQLSNRDFNNLNISFETVYYKDRNKLKQ